MTKQELAEAHRLYLLLNEKAGCCWHILLDDNNVDDDCVRWCINLAATQGHPVCIEIGPLLQRMSKTQRLKLASGGYKSLAKEMERTE
jgi:hypothetical protein